MKKYFVVALAVLAMVVVALPAFADTVFNESSKCIQSWGKECTPCAPGDTTAPKVVKSVDALGNTVSLVTDNSGKNTLGQ